MAVAFSDRRFSDRSGKMFHVWIYMVPLKTEVCTMDFRIIPAFLSAFLSAFRPAFEKLTGKLTEKLQRVFSDADGKAGMKS